MGYEDTSSTTSEHTVIEGGDRHDQEGMELNEAEIGRNTTGTGKGISSVGLNRTKSGLLARRLSESRRKRLKEEKENSGKKEVPIAVVEQRVSNLAQGALCKFPHQLSRLLSFIDAEY